MTSLAGDQRLDQFFDPLEDARNLSESSWEMLMQNEDFVGYLVLF